MAETISPDYLVIGAGAMGMAFVDTLIADNTQATVAIVDRYSRPGGHWTIAYPFVTLHQPSIAYGVNSRHLGEDKIDQVGLNKGLMELATGDEVCAYFGKVMQQTFLPSGRVVYYPKHDYLGEGKFRSIITHKTIQVGPNTRIVDATYMKVVVPAMRPPVYEVVDGVEVIAPNGVSTLSRPHNAYTVVGAGKTGVDACLWLITNGIDPKKISWIMPRDSWFYERGSLQPTGTPEQNAQKFAAAGVATMNATSTEDLFLRLEACGSMVRMDKNIMPTMFRCAIISALEFEQIQRIGNIIRKGRVTRLSPTEVTLEQGTYKPEPDTLYIDCTADGLAKLEPTPVFNGKNITLQAVRFCQQVFSAAVIARVEAMYEGDDVKNDLCGVVPHPDEPADYPGVIFKSYQNGLKWMADPKMASWLKDCRLDLFGARSRYIAKVEDGKDAAAEAAAQLKALCDKVESLMVKEAGEVKA
ncbi:hypothetical protein NX059_004987 [Plenodomus lindquistii]|nr:hypothetical protein NX059_004987 [Plenodomus lindquistii]